MKNKNIEDLKKQMDELSFDLSTLNQAFDQNIKEVQDRFTNTVLQKEKEWQEVIQKQKEKTYEQNFEITNTKDSETTNIITDLNRETSHLIQVLNLEKRDETSFNNTSKKTPLLDSINDRIKKNIGRIKEISLKESIKPKAKCKKKSRKQQIEAEQWKKTLQYYKCLFAGGTLATTMLVTPATIFTLNHLPPKQPIEMASDEIKNGALQEYKENIFDPNTNTVIHSHDLIEMMYETAQKYEDPIVGFYLVYQNLDDWCKNYKIDDFIYKYNLVFQTNYLNIENFLEVNHFQDMKELEAYVLERLNEEELEVGRGL